MNLDLFQVDAFASHVFRGNPAAIVPLDGAWLADELMQSIAAENNLSETAFFRPSEAVDVDFDLRWFTPTTEVDLCGHATLAAAHVLFEHLDFPAGRVRFQTASGPLAVEKRGIELSLDLPVATLRGVDADAAITRALGAAPTELFAARDLLAVFDSAQDVADLTPDFRAFCDIEQRAIIATAPGDGAFDFVSRFFAPGSGVDEDPVTGSAHCCLVPYWAKRLGREQLLARQISRRGGDLSCTLAGERVHLAGEAHTYLRGAIDVPG
ncbi:MAG: PhzF family phenazine biosynthesis protein [Planctomycetota bacterium]